MHSHIDRDRFVRIKWENVKNDERSNFDKVDPEWFDNYGTRYDPRSVMHYHSTAFSKNGKKTIVPIESKYNDVIGQREGISTGDVKRLNNMYDCAK